MSDLATLEAPVTNPTVRTDWSREEIAALFDLPFTELVFRAAAVHRDHHRVHAAVHQDRRLPRRLRLLLAKRQG